MVAFKLLLGALAGLAAAQGDVKLRYMPFGDSITEIICWRALLWEKLQTTEWASVDWVGSGKTENSCKDTKYDRDNEGHSGFLAINIANNKQLVGWLQKNPADVITMHLGTNDIVQQNKAVDAIIAAFTTLVEVMRTSNPRMKIIVRLGSLLLVLSFTSRYITSDLLSQGCSNHPHGYRQLQHQDPGPQQGNHPLGSENEQDRVPNLDRRSVHWLQRG